MIDLSVAQNLTEYKPANKVRFVTAASLFDGHDASINIMRRILQSNGVEVVHLGHNRSVDDVRDLRERVAYAPAGGHWKVYILDEAHMVTGHGVGSLVPLMVSWKIAARFVDCSCWFIVVSFQRPLRGVRSLFWVGGM